MPPASPPVLQLAPLPLRTAPPGLGTRREHAAERRQRVGAVLRVGQAVHGGDHVRGAEGGAVRELDPGLQGEGPDAAIGIRRPGARQHGLQHQVGAVADQELARLHQHQQAADIGRRHRVDRAGRHRGGDADGRAGFALRAGLRAAEQCEAQPDPCGVAQQAAPIEPAGGELVQHMVAQRAGLAPQRVKLIGSAGRRHRVLQTMARQCVLPRWQSFSRDASIAATKAGG